MVNTKELMVACFEAETKEEMWNCRNLANSIAERSPWAWRMYYSGEAEAILSQKSLRALERVMKRVEMADERNRAKRKLVFEGENAKKVTGVGSTSTSKQNRVLRVRSRVRGAKIANPDGDVNDSSGKCEKRTEKDLECGRRRKSGRIEGKKVTFEDEVLHNKGKVVEEEKRVLVCALAAENMASASDKKKKGKAVVDCSKKKGKVVVTEFTDVIDGSGKKTNTVLVGGEAVGKLVNVKEEPLELKNVRTEVFDYVDDASDDDDVIILGKVKEVEDQVD